jgi:tetratricopeptide (TPR) repeat protein
MCKLTNDQFLAWIGRRSVMKAAQNAAHQRQFSSCSPPPLLTQGRRGIICRLTRARGAGSGIRQRFHMSSLVFSSGDLIADRRADYAQALAGAGDLLAAIDLMSQALEMVPGWAAGWFRLAEWHEAAGQTDAARSCWQRVIASDPADRLGAGLRLDLVRAVPVTEAMPAAFVETLFDQYAERFETSLVDQLGYQGPAQIVAALLLAGRTRFERVLDLGCGTGLMGQAIRPHAGWLEGYDISGRMLAQARGKGVYDGLHKRDLSRLELGGDSFDLGSGLIKLDPEPDGCQFDHRQEVA